MANDILSRHPASPLWLAVARNGSYTPAVRRGIAGPRPMWMASLSGFEQGGSLISHLAGMRARWAPAGWQPYQYTVLVAMAPRRPSSATEAMPSSYQYDRARGLAT